MNPGNSDQHANFGNHLDPEALQSLILHARSGDATALGSLISGFRNYLLVIAKDRVDRRLQSKFGASDVVQESLVHAQLNFRQFGGTTVEELKAWLRTILVNDIRKCHRTFATQKRSMLREISVDRESAVGRLLEDTQPTPFSDALQRERVAALTQALAGLPADYQQVIQLRNMLEMDFAEIGVRMDRSPDAARKLWARAVEALRDAVAASTPELLERPGEHDERA